MLSKKQWANLACKADWEGGWAEYILGYGGVTKQLEDDPDFKEVVIEFENAWHKVQAFLDIYGRQYGECWQLESELT